jgi:hypothetical protein
MKISSKEIFGECTYRKKSLYNLSTVLDTKDPKIIPTPDELEAEFSY